MGIEEQLDFLMEGSYFADEGEGVPAGGLRGQMRAELKAKLELSAKLREKGSPDWRLRAYIGVDPTRESLHIGHMIPVVKLARFQALGHTAVFLIGDYTAMIGDPTGQSKEREQLTHERVLELSRFYQDQAFRLLDPEKTEVRYNGEWLGGLGFAELSEVAARFPLSAIVARQDFRARLDAGQPVGSHELFYAMMQGYDAYALNCDVQVGGYDQHLNLLAGRTLQAYFQKKLAKGGPDGGPGEHPLFAAQPSTGARVKGPHVMLTFNLLMGTDGRKMSKSWGNTVDVLDAPEDMFGKIMRISDAMLAHYIEIAIEAPTAVKQEQKERSAADPMGVKKWIAHSITAMYHGSEVADRAEEHFRRTVQEKEFTEEDVELLPVANWYRDRLRQIGLLDLLGITAAGHAESLLPPPGTTEDDLVRRGAELNKVRLTDLLKQFGLAANRKDAERKIADDRTVSLDGVTVRDIYAPFQFREGMILKVGKRKVVRLV